jgi:hypothetical protein
MQFQNFRYVQRKTEMILLRRAKRYIGGKTQCHPVV